MKKPTKAQKKVRKVMHEFKAGSLHSGKKGPVVKNRKQAIAIALSEAGVAKKRGK
jgi:phosphodiesterase/alkaline phosphatase D-like protein